MARAFAEIAFTDSVKAAQSRYGTSKANTGFEFDAERHAAPPLGRGRVWFVRRGAGHRCTLRGRRYSFTR